jgi:hypothetical protein
VEQAHINDFLKEIAVGFRTAKSYPPGHPVMDKTVETIMEQMSILSTELNEFSMFFLEQTIIFQDMKIDVRKNPALLAMLDSLRKIEIDSLTFNSNVTQQDVKNLLEVLSTPKMKIKEYGDPPTMLDTKGTSNIKINAVQFGVQTSGTVTVAGADQKSARAKEEILGALKNLKTFVDKGLSVQEMQEQLSEVAEDIEQAPEDSKKAYSQSIAELLQNVPAEQRMQLFQNMDMQPFMLQLMSGANSDFLTQLILQWSEHNKESNIHHLLGSVDENKLARMIPALKQQMPNIYEHLAHAGVRLLLSDKLAAVVTEDDLRMSIEPYFAMLESNNVTTRENALRSLMILGNRFIDQGSYDIAKNIIARLSIALDQEPIIEVIERIFDEIVLVYQVCRKHHQKDFCAKLLEPFNAILSKERMTIAFKKRVIEFLGETGHPLGLSMLFSMVWESGIFPEVRSSIVKFGAAAVNQAIITLRDVEDYNIRMRLVDIMKNVGTKSITILLKNLAAPEWFLRRNILTILQVVGTPEVVTQLEPLLKDEDHRVRLELVKTFTKLGYTEGLLKALHDTSTEVTAEALKGLKKKLSSERFVELLPRFTDTGDAVYIEVLGIIEDKTLFEAADWIHHLLVSLQERNDSVARDIKELGLATLIKLKPQNLKSILEHLSNVEDKGLAKLARHALDRMQ